MLQIAIQGIQGSYHEIAMFKFFGEREPIELIECDSFRNQFNYFKTNEDAYGVLAIENTIAGSIIGNYNLLLNSEMRIIGEVYLRIEHCLMAGKNSAIGDLQRVYSHPMALLQCHKYFDQHPHIELIEGKDTADCAKKLSTKPSGRVGVIASYLAAEYYDLKVIEKGIETNKRNFTRFLVLQHQSKLDFDKEFINKASISFKLSHEAGSLANVLDLLARNQINLTKIQSLPVVGEEWQYFFLLDVEFSDREIYRNSLNKLSSEIIDLRILGEYQRGNKFKTW